MTRERLYLDAMSAVYGGTRKVLVDVDGDAPMFYLPLEGMQRQGTTSRVPTAPSVSSGSSPLTAPSTMPRDSSRDRDRAR